MDKYNDEIDDVKYFSVEENYDDYCIPDELYDCEYIPSATRGDYSPSAPWNAPEMSISDFI